MPRSHNHYPPYRHGKRCRPGWAYHGAYCAAHNAHGIQYYILCRPEVITATGMAYVDTNGRARKRYFDCPENQYCVRYGPPVGRGWSSVWRQGNGPAPRISCVTFQRRTYKRRAAQNRKRKDGDRDGDRDDADADTDTDSEDDNDDRHQSKVHHIFDFGFAPVEPSNEYGPSTGYVGASVEIEGESF